ncbi:MAG: DUF177 domain-containing protein [Bacteroidetes bacterium]|nr:DUF177 domain-containing protein [Bacteroidota bacterium]MDA1120648.1 DUF177 domain-containing protein [Bacteroidota bacterium]
MRSLDQFEVNISNLKSGINEFKFTIDNLFFSEFPECPVKVGTGECEVQIDQKVNLLTVNFHLAVEIELICDRSLEKFMFPIQTYNNLIIKFGDYNEEIDDDIAVISWDEKVINLAQYIYEYIVVAVPMKKLHPKYITENESEFGEIIYRSDDDDDNDDLDPRWNTLKNLN